MSFDFPKLGELRRVITLQVLDSTPDGDNQPNRTPRDISAAIPAKLFSESSEIEEIAGQKTLVITWLIWFAYRPGPYGSQANWNGRTLKFITEPQNLGELNRFIFVKAREASPNVQ